MRKRAHTIRLTSEDVVSECQFEVTDYVLKVIKDLARAVNSQASFSVDVRMFVDPTDSATKSGDAA
jgi:hypothetical protein